MLYFRKTQLFSFLEIKFQGLFFGLLFTFFSHQGIVAKIPSARISLTYIHVFAHPIDFFALPIVKKIRIYQVWFLFGVIPGVDSYSCHFGTINK